MRRVKRRWWGVIQKAQILYNRKYNYKIIADKYNQILKEQKVITHLYVPDSHGVQVTATNEKKEKPENSVHAKLRLELTKSDVSFVNYMQNVVGMPTEYVVNCFMYDETTKTST